MIMLLVARVVVPAGGILIFLGDVFLGWGPFAANYKADGIIVLATLALGVLFWRIPPERQFFGPDWRR